ncbi:MAG TPA: hypothetical protein VGB52_10650 [Actinomycetota bacterium]
MTILEVLPRRLRAPLAAVLVIILLLVSIGVSLRRDPFAFLFPFGRGPGLDYSAGPGGFAPLDPSYIADILGEQRAAPTSGVSSPVRRSDPGSGSFEPPRRLTDVHPLTNDDRGDARAVPGVPFTARTNTSAAGREPGEPADCGRLGGTVWYRYAPSRDVGLIANTFGSSYATALGVFEQDADGGLSSIGCDSDLDGNAIYQFSAAEGSTYLFQIAGSTGGGDLVFSLEPQGTTVLASAVRDGQPATGYSRQPSMSADGRFLAFTSTASDLAAGADPAPCTVHTRSLGGFYTSITAPEEPCQQVIVLDRRTGEFVLASVNDHGEPGNGGTTTWPMISGNGRYVAFTSTASNLVPDDSNDIADAFVHDLVTRRTKRVSMAYTGEELQLELDPNGYGFPVYGGSVFHPAISHDGRFVAFSSSSSMLVENDRNHQYDVFVHDRRTGFTERVSVSSAGREGNQDSITPFLSRDGRYVTFTSAASTLTWDAAPGGVYQLFIHDRETGETTLESISTTGEPGDGDSGWWPASPMTPDGRYVLFGSVASNLVPGDTNGIIDVFVRDRVAGTTTRVSVSSSGEQGEPPAVETGDLYFVARDSLLGPLSADATAWTGGISSDGRYVVFDSQANGLVPEDTNNLVDVFVHDLHTATTVRVSTNLGGDAFRGDSSYGVMSADGRIIAFTSLAQLGDDPARDVLAEPQIYIHERVGAFR